MVHVANRCVPKGAYPTHRKVYQKSLDSWRAATQRFAIPPVKAKKGEVYIYRNEHQPGKTAFRQVNRV